MFVLPSAFSLAFLAVFPVVISLKPTTSWHTTPTFLQVRYVPTWNITDYQYMTNYSLVTIQPGDAYPTEQNIRWVRNNITKLNPKIPVLFYYNVFFSEPTYAADKIVQKNPQWWINQTNGQPYKPGGRYTFDQSVSGAQIFWNSVVSKAVKTGGADGAFADSGCGGDPIPWFSPSHKTAYDEGQLHVQTVTAKGLGNSHLFVSNCEADSHKENWFVPDKITVNGVMFENFCFDFGNVHGPHHAPNCLKEIMRMRLYSKWGNTSTVAHYYVNRHNEYQTKYGVAAFLIAAYNESFLGCSADWNLAGDWQKWNADYISKPLGIPKTGPVPGDKYGCLWSREFGTGTSVSVNLCEHGVTIKWSSGELWSSPTETRPQKKHTTEEDRYLMPRGELLALLKLAGIEPFKE